MKIGAEKHCLFEVLGNITRDMGCKLCTLLITFIISFIVLLAIVYNDNPSFNLQRIISCLSTANLNMLGVDIAALSILFALFHNKMMDKNAEQAFKEQNISFIGNAFLQLIAFLLSIGSIGNMSSYFLNYITLFVQIWAMILVFDLIIEIYTLHSAITNKIKL